MSSTNPLDKYNMWYCDAFINNTVITPLGKIKPCTQYQGDFGDIDQLSNPRNVPTNWTTECVKCELKERQGQQSVRNRFNLKKEKKIEIAISNKCNLYCVMCDGEYSSSWIAHEKSRPDIFDFKKSKNKNYQSLPEIFEYITKEEIKKVVVVGGEPLMEVDFLDKLSEINSKVIIHTNATQTQHIKKLSKIKNLMIICSIDGIEQHYEYVRGFEFDEIEKNMKLFKDNFDTVIKPTWNCLNYTNRTNYIKWAESNSLKIVGENVVFYPSCLSAGSIPMENRELSDLEILSDWLKLPYDHKLHIWLQKYVEYFDSKRKSKARDIASWI